jgi:phosphocarrier protein HPr
MYSKEVTIQNEQGLHARPAQLFIRTSNQFESQIKVRKEDRIEADAKSILGLMSLSLNKGSTIIIEANGEDETEAVDALVDLVDGKFGEA